jgi:AcrR family transcriptional regulator
MPERGGPVERKKKYDEKLLLILDSACGIFAEKGYHNASVRDVAAATGVSPAGLYYYFQSKEELLHLILDACLSSLMDRIRDDVVGIQDPAVRLRAIIRTHLAHFESNGKEMRVLVHEWKTLSGPFGKQIRGLMREYVQVVIRTFEDLSPDQPPTELRAAAFGLFGMLAWVDQWYRPGRDLPLELLAERFSGIFLGGFLSEPQTEAATRRTETATRRTEAEETTRERSKQSSASSILSGPGF